MLHECAIETPLIKYAGATFDRTNETARDSSSFPSFYLTSIYDHSIHEAFSKIIQSQMRQLRALENMLDLVTAVGEESSSSSILFFFCRPRNWIRFSCVIFTTNSVSLRIRNLSIVNCRNYVVMSSMSTRISRRSTGKRRRRNNAFSSTS